MIDFDSYWNDIPIGKENAVTYAELCCKWDCAERAARAILHELSIYDSGDDYILIRSSSCKGFYKTDDKKEIQAYRRECLNKGRSVFAPIKKINRVLLADDKQFSFGNNLRVIRESKGLKQSEVCDRMKQDDKSFDKPLLSKMENGVCLPTFRQALLLSIIYDCLPSELIDDKLYH